MNFYVNGQQLDITLETEKTVGDILRSFETICESNKCTTIGLEVNKEIVTADNFDKVAEQSFDSETVINATVVSEQSILDAFKQSASLADETVPILEQVPVMLQSGKDADAFKAIETLANIIDNFCHTVTLSSLFPEKFGNLKIDGKTISEFFEDFAPIFNDFNEALKNSDTVLIGDLSEYEICPRLKALSVAVKGL